MAKGEGVKGEGKVELGVGGEVPSFDAGEGCVFHAGCEFF